MAARRRTLTRRSCRLDPRCSSKTPQRDDNYKKKRNIYNRRLPSTYPRQRRRQERLQVIAEPPWSRSVTVDMRETVRGGMTWFICFSTTSSSKPRGNSKYKDVRDRLILTGICSPISYGPTKLYCPNMLRTYVRMRIIGSNSSALWGVTATDREGRQDGVGRPQGTARWRWATRALAMPRRCVHAWLGWRASYMVALRQVNSVQLGKIWANHLSRWELD
jgi:hypothetical protein